MADEREAALAAALSLQQNGRLAEAERLFRSAIATSGTATDALHARALAGLGATLLALGRLDEALAACEAAAAVVPNSAEANFNLAGAYIAARRPADALACYERTLAANPSQVEAHYGMGMALGLLARPDEAAAAYEKALAIDPDFAEAALALGRTLQKLGRHEEAARRFAQALDVDPDYTEARFGLATSLLALERNVEAVAAFDQVLASAPDHTAAHRGRARTLAALGRHEEALENLSRAAELLPSDARVALELARGFNALGRTDEAIAACERAVALDPESATAHADLGALLVISGRIAEAEAAYRKAIALEPRKATYYADVAGLRRVQRDDPLLDAMEALACDMATLPELEQAALHFALGKAYADVGEPERSFAHYREGGALKRRSLAYDSAQTIGLMDRIRTICTADLIASRAGWGHLSDVPILIVGMPRSGTSLAEQILASHPDIHGAGERTDLTNAVGPGFPETVPAMSPGELRAFGGRYAAGLSALAPGAARITDKLPSNFLYLGLIRMCLPNARIIHMRRDPIDTCLSCFTTSFAGDSLPYTYDLAELGGFYSAYARLMAHWRNVLGADGFLEVEYEALVDDFEAQAQRIVGYCGLPWDDACLAFHETRRAVRTASAVQVRQPLYRSSVGRWRPAGSVLQPLLDAIAGKRG